MHEWMNRAMVQGRIRDARSRWDIGLGHGVVEPNASIGSQSLTAMRAIVFKGTDHTGVIRIRTRVHYLERVQLLATARA